MYKSLEQALLDLEKAGMLKRIHAEVDPHSKFRAACNIFGSDERFNFLFREGFGQTKTAVNFKANPVEFFKHATPAKLLRAMRAGIRSLPKRSGSIKDFEECSLSDLPQLVSWPLDGGAFITLPQVATPE